MVGSDKIIPFPKPIGPAPRVALNNATLGYPHPFAGKASTRARTSIAIVPCASILVRGGDIVAIIGRNGSGKKTILRSISGLIPPLDGSIEVDGATANMFDIASQTFLGATVGGHLDAVAHTLQLRGELRAQYLEAVSREVLSRFALSPSDIVRSTNTANQVLFVAWIAARTPILLCDTAVLRGDEHWTALAMAMLRSSIAPSRAILLAGHDLEIMRAICNRAIWTDRRGLLGQGKPNDVIQAYLRGSNR